MSEPRKEQKLSHKQFSSFVFYKIPIFGSVVDVLVEFVSLFEWIGSKNITKGKKRIS